MEKFFIVPEETKLGKDLLEYEVNRKEVWELYKEFSSDNNIKTEMFAVDDGFLGIVPTSEDMDNFSDQLKKEKLERGLRVFKKTSKLYKKWNKLIVGKVDKIIGKPYLPCYFECHGKMTFRLFREKEIIYCSMYHASDFNNPEGFVEISGSNFYKVLEGDK